MTARKAYASPQDRIRAPVSSYLYFSRWLWVPSCLPPKPLSSSRCCEFHSLLLLLRRLVLQLPRSDSELHDTFLGKWDVAVSKTGSGAEAEVAIRANAKASV
jgi:hypothetical protein